MELTAKNVHDVFERCLFKEEELKDGKPEGEYISVHGIMRNFGFHPERVKAEKKNIEDMLSNLPEPFSKDGGWSFLKLCEDKNGNHWGEHLTMELLMVLGIAIGKVEYSFPRELWRALPGGVPYITIKN